MQKNNRDFQIAGSRNYQIIKLKKKRFIQIIKLNKKVVDMEYTYLLL